MLPAQAKHRLQECPHLSRPWCVGTGTEQTMAELVHHSVLLSQRSTGNEILSGQARHYLKECPHISPTLLAKLCTAYEGLCSFLVVSNCLRKKPS